MEIFSYNELNEFNRILISVKKLSDKDNKCRKQDVINYCSSIIFGGSQANHRKNIELCNKSELLKTKNNILQLTILGEEFITLNKNSQYEVTKEQEEFISKRIIFEGPWKHQIKSLLDNFSPNYSKLTYELSLIDNPLPKSFYATIYLLKRLNILNEEEGIYFVNPKYVVLVKELTLEKDGLSEDKLEESLKQSKKISILAEDAILKYEKKRLKLLQCDAEAEIVRRISTLNVSAGYDIESFDGRKDFFDYDRFIEVKASQKDNIYFYWSINEYNIAKKKSDRYWIYFIPNFKGNNLKEVTPIMIQNPVKKIRKANQFRVSISNYRIEQIGKITFKSLDIKGIEGYII